MYKEVFKIRIKQIREDLGLTQIKVSADTGIDQSILSKYESGNLEPDLEKLGKLANYYQVSTDWLIGNIYFDRKGKE